MPDRTAASRVRKQRQLRAAQGWHEVKVWVPTEADAEDVRKLAEERRQRAEELHGLSREVGAVNAETEMRIAKAIAEHGSRAFNTPSGAVLELMSHLAEEDDLEGFSCAVVILARAKPPSAPRVFGAVPGSISNFLIKHRGVDPIVMRRWFAKHPEWQDDLKVAVRDPSRFKVAVEAMADAIKREQAKH